MSDSDRKELSPHKQEQLRMWREFKAGIEDLKNDSDLGVTYKEIAKGLSISRQSLFNFLKEENKAIHIERHNVLELWDYLTDTVSIDSKSRRQAREKLRKEREYVLNDLLQSAGFLPVSKNEPQITPHIERIKARLLSPWISNQSVLADITGAIIDTILDKGGFSQDPKRKTDINHLTFEEIKKEPNRFFSWREWTKIQKTFMREIERFVTLGKVRFYHEEEYELFQSILENHNLRKYPGEMTAIGCEFKTLSFAIEDYAEKEIKEFIFSLCDDCERYLRPNLEFSEKDIFPSVIESDSKFLIIDKDKNLNLEFRYTCCGTHVEAAIIALSSGIGYPLSSSLSLTNFSVNAIGKNSESLARVSVTLTEISDNENDDFRVFQGLWVDQNIFLGILKAINFAILNWLSSYLDNSLVSSLYDVFNKFSSIRVKLHKNIEKVYNFRSYREDILKNSGDIRLSSKNLKTNSEPGKISTEEMELELIAREISDLSKLIETISQKFLESRDDKSLVDSNDLRDNENSVMKYFEVFKKKLDQRLFLSKLSKARINLFECNLEQANSVLSELDSKLFMGETVKTSDSSMRPIAILFESENILLRTLSGDYELFSDNGFKGNLLVDKANSMLQDLCEFAIEQNTGIIDCDLYLAAGQYLGILGLFKFCSCSCKDEDRKDLESAAKFFIQSSHLSARIGHRQRTFRCLYYASRVFCRLNQEHKARKVNEMADQVLKNEEGDQPNSYTSQSYLSKGEIELFFPGDDIYESYIRAFYYFSIAWKKSCLFSFERTKLGSLYNIFRVLNKIRDVTQYSNIEEVINDLDNMDTEKILINRQMSYDIASMRKEQGNNKNIAVTIIDDIINDESIFFGEKIYSISIEYFQDKLLGYVMRGFDKWHFSIYGESHGHHPFIELINNGSFIGLVKPRENEPSDG